jgi:hypothetical protein
MIIFSDYSGIFELRLETPNPAWNSGWSFFIDKVRGDYLIMRACNV